MKRYQEQQERFGPNIYAKKQRFKHSSRVSRSQSIKESSNPRGTPKRSRNENTSLSMDNLGQGSAKGIKLSYDPNSLSLADQAREYKLNIAQSSYKDQDYNRSVSKKESHESIHQHYESDVVAEGQAKEMAA